MFHICFIIKRKKLYQKSGEKFSAMTYISTRLLVKQHSEFANADSYVINAYVI